MEKKHFKKAIPHVKISCGSAFKSDLKVSRGWNYTSDHVPAVVNCRSQFKSFTTSTSLQQALAGSQKRTDINADLPSCFLVRLPLTAHGWHHPWSHYSLASSQEKLSSPQPAEERSTQSKSKLHSTKEKTQFVSFY